MTDKKNLSEDEVFRQEITEEELEAAGGKKDPFYLGCSSSSERYIHTYHFPNCASTAEEDSWCDLSDACITSAIKYKGMDRCKKAHD
jgi:hypothetical protein